MEEQTEILSTGHAPCPHLRCKEMFYQNPEDFDPEQSSGHYWCIQTQETFGPDGEPVGRSECHPNRRCYPKSQ